MTAAEEFDTFDGTLITVTNCWDLFADILSVGARQGLCAGTKEHNTVGTNLMYLDTRQ